MLPWQTNRIFIISQNLSYIRVFAGKSRRSNYPTQTEVANPFIYERLFLSFIVVKNVVKLQDLRFAATRSCCLFLEPEHICLHVIKPKVRVRVVGHIDVGVAHNVFELHGIHPLARHLRAERMAANMGSDLRQLVLVDAVVLRHGILEVLLPVKRHTGLLVLVEEQEPAHTVHHGLHRRLGTVRDHPPEALRNALGHRNVSHAAAGLRPLDVVTHVAGALKLLADADAPALEIDVPHREPAELGDAEPRVQQDVERVVIAGVVAIASNEVEEPPLLLGGQRLTRNLIVHKNGRKLEIERVSANEVIFLRELERRSQNAAYGMDRAVALPVIPLQGNEPFLRVEGRDVAYPPAAELVARKEVEHRLVPGSRGRPHCRLGLRVLGGELENGHVLGGNVVEEVPLDPLLKLAQARARPLPLRREIMGCQGPRVDAARLAFCVHVLEAVAAVLPLALPATEDAPLHVLSSSHPLAPFHRRKEPQCDS